MRAILVGAVIATTATVAFPAEPLTIGSSAPKLDVEAFLHGEPVKELSRGTIYVVEFSGTRCAPCIKCIPHLTELQKQHKDVVFISVYSYEGKKEVGAFLTKYRDKIGYRIAIDPAGTMQKTWSDAAFRQGIPDAFIIDAKGIIAWIGHPEEMAKPLAQIVNGKFDARADILRLRFQQEAARKQWLANEREKKAREAHDKINEQVIDGKMTEALTATEVALKEYADTKDGLFLLSGMKFGLLAKRSDKKDAAVEFAIELAVAAKLSGNELRCRQFADFLLNAADTPTLADRDLRLVDLAIVLLQDTDECLDLYVQQANRKQYIPGYRIVIHKQLARAYHLRGDHAKAIRQVEHTIALVKKLQPVDSEDAQEFKKTQEEHRTALAEELATYKKFAESPSKK